jgi:hypothetical protein
MVEGYLTETDRDTFNAGLLWLRERNFRDQSESDQDQLVKELAEEARKQSSETENKPFFLLAKEMTLLGFFTSEVGGHSGIELRSGARSIPGLQAARGVGRKGLGHVNIEIVANAIFRIILSLVTN